MLRPEDCFSGNKVICIKLADTLLSGEVVNPPITLGNVYTVKDYIPPNHFGDDCDFDTECIQLEEVTYYYFGLSYFRTIPNGLEIFYDLLSKPIDETVKDENVRTKKEEKV